MPLAIQDDGPTKFPDPKFLTFDKFDRGVITLIDQSKLPRNALREADNLILTEDGTPGTRYGVGWFGTTIATPARTASFTQTTNLITNPSFETNTTGWSGFSATLTRVTTEFYSGTASCSVLTTGGGGGQGIWLTSSLSGLTSSTTYTGSVYVKATTGVPLTVTAITYTTGGIQVATYTSTGTGDGSWQRFSVTAPLGSTETKMQFQITTTSATTFYVDAFQVEQNPSATDYFDGSLTDTTTTDYDWTGVANASTSTRKVYVMSTAAVDGFDYFDFSGVIHLVVAAGGTIYRSTNDGSTWTACTGATYTSGTPVNFNQYNSGLYITTGLDNIIVYDGSTTLASYTALTTPAAPTAAKTGLAGTTYTYYYKQAAVNTLGFSIASPSVSISVDRPREQWDQTSNYVTVTTAAPQATQTRTDLYFSEDNVNFYYLSSIVSSTAVPNVTFKDTGPSAAVVVPSTVAPTGNTSQGPKVAELVNVGSRMYGVRDPNNPYRIWFTSGTPPLGAFSSAYDGGYLDWQPGGKYKPVMVADYRDGKGTPLATIWCSSADGQGCILQMSLDTVTVGDISVTVPSAYKLPGSRGTNAPGSVVNVLNDYMYYNSQAFYNLGSRAQFLNLLSTDEASANIRPTVKTINNTYASSICSTYFDAKVFFSVAYDSNTTNSHTIIYDTERKAWLPTAFTIGFKKFLRYTDTGGTQRLLAIKPGDSRLSEIRADIQGDYGVAFRTSLLTGLYPVTKNRFEFQDTSEGYIELSNPQGTTTIDLLGIDRKNGYSTIKTVNLSASASTTNVGWDTFDDDTTGWDDTSTAPVTYSEPSVKRYFLVGRELNAVQWHLTTYSLDARYLLRTLQTSGTDTNAGPPKQWRLKT